MRKESLSRVKILRFDPEKDPLSYFQEFFVSFEKEKTILDSLYYIYSHLDETLAFRGSCFTGWCRVCMLKVDGKVVFPCKNWMKKEMLIEPIPNYPVIKDLIVDFTEKDTKGRISQKFCDCEGSSQKKYDYCKGGDKTKF